MEEWKDIKGYEGIYQVSSYGRVRSMTHKAGNGKTYKSHILKPIKRCGYLTVNLSRSITEREKVSIHRLVAVAFVPNPNGYNVINHIDENKHNNIPSNLEWCTNAYNVTYKNAISKRVASRTHFCVKCDKEGNEIERYESAIIASKQTGYAPQSIRYACSSGMVLGGYSWHYTK